MKYKKIIIGSLVVILVITIVGVLVFNSKADYTMRCEQIKCDRINISCPKNIRRCFNREVVCYQYDDSYYLSDKESRDFCFKK